jgi:hypothetical protein
MFTITFAKLIRWKAMLALIVWPSFLGLVGLGKTTSGNRFLTGWVMATCQSFSFFLQAGFFFHTV